MRRLRSDKRYALDCFLSREPADEAEPDAPSEFWDTRTEAEARAWKIVRAGRFKCVDLYDSQPAEWDHLETFREPMPGEEPEPWEPPAPEKKPAPVMMVEQEVERRTVKRTTRKRKRVAVRKKAAKAGKRPASRKAAASTRKAKARKRKG